MMTSQGRKMASFSIITVSIGCYDVLDANFPKFTESYPIS